MTLSRLEKSSFLEVPVSEIQTRMSDFEADINRMGSLAIFDNRNLCYTVFNPEKSDRQTALKMYGKLLNLFKQQISLIKDSLENFEFDLDQKDRHRKAIKIYCTLLANSVKDRIMTQKTNIPAAKSKRTKKTETESSVFDQPWLDHCERYIELLTDLFSFSFHELWQPPILEEDFLRLIVSFVFKLLETGQISKIKHIVKLIATLLGSIVSKHNALLVVTLKIINIVQHIDNQSSHMAYVVQNIVTEFSYPHIIVQIFKELAHMHQGETADSASSRNIGQFISTLGAVLPREVMLNSSLLMCHLEWDPYSIRNGVLDCFSNIVITVLTKSEMDDAARMTRDSLLDKIQEHMHDVNAYVRSHVLQLFSEIVKSKALPLNRYNSITDLTIRRLNDKSCNVRKNSASFLFQLIVSNPYSQFLNIDEIAQKIADSKKAEVNLAEKANTIIKNADEAWDNIKSSIESIFKEVENPCTQSNSLDSYDFSPEIRQNLLNRITEEDYSGAIRVLRKSLDKDAQEFFAGYSCDDVVKFFKTLFFEYISLQLLKEDNIQDRVNDEDNAQMSKVANNFLKNVLDFAKSVRGAMSVVYRLLQSETISDILEVIQLITTAYKFGINDLHEAIDSILPLIWSNESTLKSAVIESCMNILSFSSKVKDRDVFINNIFLLLSDCHSGFYSAFEEFLSYAAEKNLLSPNFLKYLWSIATIEDVSDSRKVNMVTVLGMVVKGQTSIFDQNLEIISKIGFSKDSSHSLAIATCVAICNYSQSKRKGNETILKFENGHILFRKLKNYVSSRFLSLKAPLWSPLYEHAIKVIVALSDSPIILINEILKEMYTSLEFRSPKEDCFSIDSVLLGRILHAVSHSAFGLLMFLEGDFLTELKRRSAIVQRFKSKPKKKNRKSTSVSTLNDDNNDDQMPGGATADETEADFVKELTENEVLHSENIFYNFIPLILHIIDKSSLYSSDLVSAASLALSKLMLLSSDFCSKHLQLLFTLLKKSPDEVIRANIVILIGDIIQRFPNFIEPWMPNVFACLRDESINVRKAVLAVLSTLILNDMVKIKGHISELALCIEDSDPIISARTRLFFTELSRKDNAIYNILPDVISRLSNNRDSLDRSLFEKVMKFLLKFLQKEKHCESLVEKLCNRFASSDSLNEQLDIVYCFMQLNFSEKSFKKLVDNFPSFKDKMYDDQLYENFSCVISKFKKSAREEIKVLVDGFEAKLLQAHVRGLNEEILNNSNKTVQDSAHSPSSPSVMMNRESPKRKFKPKRQRVAKQEPPVPRKRGRRGRKAIGVGSEDTASDTPPNKKH